MDSMHSTVAIIVAEVGRAPAPFKPTVVSLLQRSGGADYTVYALLTFFKLAAAETPSSGDSSVVKGSLAPLACPRTTSDATLLTKRGRDGDAKKAEESTISKGGQRARQQVLDFPVAQGRAPPARQIGIRHSKDCELLRGC